MVTNKYIFRSLKYTKNKIIKGNEKNYLKSTL